MEFTGERFVPNQTELELEIEHFQRYKFAEQFIENKVVLDAACGEGYGSDILSNGAELVCGIDISREAINEAIKKYNKENIKFIESNVTKLPFDSSYFDVIVSYETIEHIDEESQDLFMKEIKRTLKNDGILIMSTPNKKVYSDEHNYSNKFHKKEFYKSEYLQFLNKYFMNVNLCCQYFEITGVIEKNNDVNINKLNSINDDRAKYYIAVCSDSEVKDNYSSNMNIMNDDKYSQIINRIVDLQGEVEERNNHIKKLDKNIIDASKEIERLNEHIENLSHWGLATDKENNLLKEETAKNYKDIEVKDNIIIKQYEKIENLEKEIIGKNRQIEKIEQLTVELNGKIIHIEQLKTELNYKISYIEQLKVELNNKIGHIELLLQSDRELERIHNSRGWKLLLVLYKIEGAVIPLNSKRRFFVKLIRKCIKNPKIFLKSVNREKIKNFIINLKNGNIDKLNSKLDRFEEMHTHTYKDELVILDDSVTDYEKIDFKNEINPLVSIIIPVYNQWNYTYNCLKSIKENTDDVSYEIIIADDVSNDETKNISKYISNIKIVRNEKNLGFLLNCNNAAKAARGKYIHFLNNDTNVQKNWLSSLVELIEKENEIGMVGSKLVYSNGKLQEAGGIIWSDASGWNYGRLDDAEKPEYNYVKEVDYISGASIMIKRSLWDEIGGFDERFVPAYFEDSDLAFEVRKHGHKVMYQPKSIVVHFEGISNGTDENSGVKSYQVKNKEKFIEKWHEELNLNHFKNGENVFLARDRSKNKKTIIVIDHYIPHYDNDAGSRTIHQYLKLFLDMGFNVKFIGDNFYKHEPYATTYEQMGIEILYGEYYFNHWENWVKANSRHIDFILLNRPHISMKYIDFLKQNTNAKIVYYVVDLHFLREKRESELKNDKNLLESSKKWEKIELDIMSKSDVVFTLSTDEQTIINNKFGFKKAVISPIFYFSEVNFDKKNVKNTEGIIFVGGFKHNPNEDGVLWFVEKIFPIILNKIPDCIFTIIGSSPTNQIKNLESENVHVSGYITDDELNNYYSHSKVCVIPLRFGAGVKGKTIEAMYNRVAIVSTNIGIEGLENIDEYVKSVDNELDFANRVIELYNDNKKNEDTINRYSEYINKYFSYDGALELFKEIFRR